MILIGDKNIPFEEISFIENKSQIEDTKPNSTVVFDYDMELMKYCEQNGIAYGVVLDSITKAIYSNSLGAKYIVCKKELAKTTQNIATNYMFDSRVLAIIENEDEIEELALKNVDGIIYKGVLV